MPKKNFVSVVSTGEPPSIVSLNMEVRICFLCSLIKSSIKSPCTPGGGPTECVSLPFCIRIGGMGIGGISKALVWGFG